MPQLLGNDVRRNARRNHQGRVRVPKVMERQPTELGASNGWPEDTSHEVVLAPNPAGRRGEDEVMRTTISCRQLLRRDLRSNHRQMHDTLSARLSSPKRAGACGALHSNGAARKVEIVPPKTKHLALAETRQRGEHDQVTFGAIARKPLDLRPQEEPRLPFLMPGRKHPEYRGVDTMTPLLRAAKDLLQQLQRDCRLARCSTPHHCNLIFDLRCSNLVHSPPPEPAHRP